VNPVPAVALALALLALAPVQAQQSGGDGDRRSSRTSISYSGGGIRGVTEVVADGVIVTASEAKEFQGEAGYYEPLPLRPRSILPGIEVLRPQPGTRQASPFALAVQFRQQDAPINPASLRVLYGAERVDITERITKSAKVGPEGFTIEQAQFPPGKHRLTFQVQDERNRVAERELRLEVE
jgi:hypothetical protein